MNKKGFTLIELLAVIMLLAIIMGISSYSIVGVLKNSREQDYNLLIENINSAVEEYYMECKYSKSDAISCPSLLGGYYYAKLGDLVKYGYLKGNDVLDDGTATVVNPKDNVNISSCRIKYSYSDGKIKIDAVTSTGSCPTSY